MRKYLLSLFSLLLTLLSSCGSLWEKPIYRIGVDPDFKSLEVDGLDGNVYAFCAELFEEIAKKEGMRIAFVKTSWDILERGLEMDRYEGIISGKPVYMQETDQFDHSSLFLPTGPILVTPQDFKGTGLVDLSGKVVAIVSGSKGDLLLEGHPNLTMRFYNSMPEALNSILDGTSDAALIPNLFAQHYVHNLYHENLMVVGNPLNDSGLRLFTLHGKSQNLLDLSNNGLEMLKEDGKLKALQKKWKLILLLM